MFLSFVSRDLISYTCVTQNLAQSRCTASSHDYSVIVTLLVIEENGVTPSDQSNSQSYSVSSFAVRMLWLSDLCSRAETRSETDDVEKNPAESVDCIS